MNNITQEITKKEYLEAISNGIKDAILIMTESCDGYSGEIIREPFLKSIENGVQIAIENLWSHATDAPCSDFYYHISEGVRKAHLELNQYGCQDD